MRGEGLQSIRSEEIMGDSDVLIEAFTELASTYEGAVDQELRQFWGVGYRKFVGWLVDKIPANDGGWILDVATGTAVIPQELASRNSMPDAVIGLDITPAMLRHARQNVARIDDSTCIQLLCASGMDMPFVDGWFDVVVCGLGTHHMDVPRMLAEMRRVLKASGTLVLADVAASPLWRSFVGRLWLRVLMIQYGMTESRARAQAEVEAFSNIRSRDEWQTLLSEYAFSDVEMIELRARRRWYPRALIMTAVANGA